MKTMFKTKNSLGLIENKIIIIWLLNMKTKQFDNNNKNS